MTNKSEGSVGEFVIRAVAVTGIAMIPLVWLQGQWVRRRTPRLPPAVLDCTGTADGAGVPVRVLVIGESTAAGVGVRSHRDGLAGCIAHSLAADLGRTVHWRAIGRIGATARTVTRELLVELRDNFDVAVVALGVNDTLGLTSARRWRRDLCRLIDEIRSRAGQVTVMLSPVPPLGKFRMLPQPLRAVLGRRATVLDRAACELAPTLADVHYVPVPFEGDDRTLCEDRFHPSQHGYGLWGECVARAIATRLGDGCR